MNGADRQRALSGSLPVVVHPCIGLRDDGA
jgi:hypothetical protein